MIPTGTSPTLAGNGADNAESRPRSFLLLALSGETFAVDSDRVDLLAPLPELARPPGCPAFVEGFFRLAGELVATLRLDHLLGLREDQPGLYSPLVVLTGVTPRVALLASAALGLEAAPAGDVMATPEASSANDCVVAELRLAAGQAHVIDVDRLLLHQERERVASLAGVVERRLAALEEEPVDGDEEESGGKAVEHG